MKLPLLCGCDITSIFEGVKVSARRGRAIISLCFEGVKLPELSGCEVVCFEGLWG